MNLLNEAMKTYQNGKYNKQRNKHMDGFHIAVKDFLKTTVLKLKKDFNIKELGLVYLER